jgi:hypothetical protein
MKLAFPARGSGRLFGADLYFPLGGFLDGVDPHLMAGDAFADRFQDFETGELATCDPGPRPAVGEKDADGNNVDQCRNLKVDCAKESYCGWDGKCHRRVPVLLSPAMLELYNGSFAPSHGLQPIGGVGQVATDTLMKQLKMTIELGRAQMAGVKIEM